MKANETLQEYEADVAQVGSLGAAGDLFQQLSTDISLLMVFAVGNEANCRTAQVQNFY